MWSSTSSIGAINSEFLAVVKVLPTYGLASIGWT